MDNGVKLKGDWRKLRHILGKMTEGRKLLADEILQDLAEEVRQKLHEVVNSEPSPHNAKSTVEKKGFDAPLHWTSVTDGTGMIDDDSIIVEKKYDGDRYMYIIKGNPEKTNSRTGTSYEEIVTIAETGSDKIPPRSVLSITYSEMEGKIKRVCNKRLAEKLIEE